MSGCINFPFLTQIKDKSWSWGNGDEALNLWSGSTDSKTLDYQRTNPGEYQIVRTHTKENTWIQALSSPNHQQHPVQEASSKQHTKQKKEILSSADRITTSFSLAHQRKNKQKLSTNLTLYETYTNHWASLRRAEVKRKKEFNPLKGKN